MWAGVLDTARRLGETDSGLADTDEVRHVG
jgi:hypothetical protein